MTFAAGVDMTIFGKNLYLSIALKLSSRQSIIDSLLAGSDSATSWYKDKMNKKNPTDTSDNYYDNPNPAVDFQLSGNISDAITECFIKYSNIEWIKKQTNIRGTAKVLN